MDFESILRDDKSYPDTLELDMGNGNKFQLGAIRNLNKRDRQQISEALTAVTNEREAVAKRQAQVAKMADDATKIHQDLQTQLNAAKQQQETQQRVAANGGYDPEQVYQNDIWYGPVRKRGEAWDASIKKNADDIVMVINAMKGLASLYTDDRMDHEFENTADTRKKSKAIADWDYDKLKKYVEDNKIVDRRGFPSMREAVTRLTAAERQQEESESAYQRGLREGEMRARMGSMPRPASATAALPAGTQQPSSIDEALSPESIQQDHELMEMLNNLSTAGADLITGAK